MATLILKCPEFNGGRIELSAVELPVVLGRSRSADITIKDDLLSRRHSEIRLSSDGAFEIVDLDSTNLTIVNEKDVDQHVLCDGDKIFLGETEILVQIDSGHHAANNRTTRDIRMPSMDETRQ